jgi:peptide/nickel transport system ATP-binding protein
MTDMANVPSLCEVRDLSIAIDGDRPQTLVNDISFKIDKGGYFALVGESGSGKSVTCHSMMRLLPFKAAIAGKILIDGQDVWSLSQRQLLQFRRRSVGMVFQDPLGALSPVRTVGAQMLETLRLHHPKAHIDDLRNRAIKALQDVHIPSPASRLGVYPHQLSGGLNQRVMIALALMGAPRLLIADEPTTALDMSVQAEVLDVIDELRVKNDLAVLLVTHDLGIVRDRADHIAVLRNGRMVESGSARNVIDRPEADYSRELFEAASVDWPDRAETGRRDAPITLEFNNVNKTFFASKKDSRSGVGIPAAKDLSFRVRKGEIVALIGESGSGKTTAAKMAMGMVQPDTGDIAVNSMSGKRRGDHRTVQMIFQHPRDTLDPLMRVKDQLHEVLIVNGFTNPAERDERIARACVDVGLDAHVLERRPTYLSGGEAQRVVIARALLLEPEVLIADEPLSAVDVRIQKVILACLKGLRDRLGISILLITHDLRVVFEIADQVVVLRHGRVVEDIPVHLFTDGKRDAYTQMLLDAVPGAAPGEKPPADVTLPDGGPGGPDGGKVEPRAVVGNARL